MSEAAYGRYWSAPLTLDRHLDRLVEVYAAARQGLSASRDVAFAREAVA
jgi:hypothetical protein